MSKCSQCGLPIFHGPAGYAGPQCMCHLMKNQSPAVAQGEAVEVVAWRVSHPDHKWKVYDHNPSTWATGAFELQELMTVAQHERIVAALTRPAQTEQSAQVVPEGHRMVSTDWLQRIHRDLDACQKLIWANLRGCDPAYCADAQARLAEIDALLAAAPAQGQQDTGDSLSHALAQKCAEFVRLEAELAALKAQQAVAEVEHIGYEPANSLRWHTRRGVHDLEPGTKLYTAPQPAPAQDVAKPASQPDASALVEALRFYAAGDHLLLIDHGKWDTCSGEPINWLYDSAGTASVEDGSIAKEALSAYQPAPVDAAVCKWTRDEDTGAYDTQCGTTWHLSDGDDPAEHGQYFCHHCGRPIDHAQQRTDDQGGV